MTQQNRAGSQAEALRRMGALIAARRRALGLTQKQLAAHLLVSDKAVSKWELGGGYPDPALLAPLAAALDLTVDELLAGRQAETDKVSSPLPEQTTPGRAQTRPPTSGCAAGWTRTWPFGHWPACCWAAREHTCPA